MVHSQVDSRMSLDRYHISAYRALHLLQVAVHVRPRHLQTKHGRLGVGDSPLTHPTHRDYRRSNCMQVTFNSLRFPNCCCSVYRCTTVMGRDSKDNSLARELVQYQRQVATGATQRRQRDGSPPVKSLKGSNLYGLSIVSPVV